MKTNESKIIYTLKKLEDICRKNNYTQIALTTSLSNNDLSSVISEMTSIAVRENIPVTVDEKSSEGKILLVKALSPVNDYDSVKTIKDSDGVLLFEKMTRTSHKRFDELVEILNQSSANIIGVVCL